MSSLFDDFKLGLTEAIEYEKGTGFAKKAAYMINPVKEYSGKEIRQIRMNTGMTQKVFAAYMGVSLKTVEAWERGTNHPTGPTFRLLEILESKEISDTEYVIAK